MNPDLTQTATLWRRVGPDGLGGSTFLDPVQIACRWQDDAKVQIDPDGRESTRRAVVYTDTAEDVSLQDEIALGQDAELGERRPILEAKSSPSLDGRDRLVRIVV